MTSATTYKQQVEACLDRRSGDHTLCEQTLFPLIDEFSGFYPDATFSDYVQEFGTPEALICDLLGPATLEKGANLPTPASKKNRRRLCAVAALLLCFILTCSVLFGAPVFSGVVPEEAPLAAVSISGDAT